MNCLKFHFIRPRFTRQFSFQQTSDIIISFPRATTSLPWSQYPCNLTTTTNTLNYLGKYCSVTKRIKAVFNTLLLCNHNQSLSFFPPHPSSWPDFPETYLHSGILRIWLTLLDYLRILRPPPTTDVGPNYDNNVIIRRRLSNNNPPRTHPTTP